MGGDGLRLPGLADHETAAGWPPLRHDGEGPQRSEEKPQPRQPGTCWLAATLLPPAVVSGKGRRVWASAPGCDLACTL